MSGVPGQLEAPAHFGLRTARLLHERERPIFAICRACKLPATITMRSDPLLGAVGSREVSALTVQGLRMNTALPRA